MTHRCFWMIVGICLIWATGVAMYSLAALSAVQQPGRAAFIVQPVHEPEVGQVLDMWRGVPVRHNGEPYWRSVGAHSADSGYYYGKQWQCVEYVKRFYYDALGHEMPEVMGHARSFFDPEIAHGEMNQERNLVQFRNGGDEAPRVDDLIVWQQDTYGHVAIVCKVYEDAIEVIQQNVLSGTRSLFPMKKNEDGMVEIGHSDWKPAGWLRLP